MQKDLIDLLKKLESSYPKNLTLGEFRKEEEDSQTFSHAFARGLVEVSNGSPFMAFNRSSYNYTLRCNLSSKGFDLLNRIRLEEAIEKLDSSIKKFNESSDKSANIIKNLTIVILIMAIVQVAITLVNRT